VLGPDRIRVQFANRDPAKPSTMEVVVPDMRMRVFTEQGVRSALRATVRVSGAAVGFLDFSSRAPRRYTDEDAEFAIRVADHAALALAHQQLSEERSRAAALKERTASLSVLDGLLDTLTDVLDIRDVFDQVSQLVQRVLAHDLMGVAEVSEDGRRLRLYARAG